MGAREQLVDVAYEIQTAMLEEHLEERREAERQERRRRTAERNARGRVEAGEAVSGTCGV